MILPDPALLDGSKLPGKVVRVNAGADVALVKVTAPVNTPCLPVAKDRGLALHLGAEPDALLGRVVVTLQDTEITCNSTRVSGVRTVRV